MFEAGDNWLAENKVVEGNKDEGEGVGELVGEASEKGKEESQAKLSWLAAGVEVKKQGEEVEEGVDEIEAGGDPGNGFGVDGMEGKDKGAEEGGGWRQFEAGKEEED